MSLSHCSWCSRNNNKNPTQYHDIRIPPASICGFHLTRCKKNEQTQRLRLFFVNFSKNSLKKELSFSRKLTVLPKLTLKKGPKLRFSRFLTTAIYQYRLWYYSIWRKEVGWRIFYEVPLGLPPHSRYTKLWNFENSLILGKTHWIFREKLSCECDKNSLKIQKLNFWLLS